MNKEFNIEWKIFVEFEKDFEKLKLRCVKRGGDDVICFPLKDFLTNPRRVEILCEDKRKLLRGYMSAEDTIQIVEQNGKVTQYFGFHRIHRIVRNIFQKCDKEEFLAELDRFACSNFLHDFYWYVSQAPTQRQGISEYCYNRMPLWVERKYNGNIGKLLKNNSAKVDRLAKSGYIPHDVIEYCKESLEFRTGWRQDDSSYVYPIRMCEKCTRIEVPYLSQVAASLLCEMYRVQDDHLSQFDYCSETIKKICQVLTEKTSQVA